MSSRSEQERQRLKEEYKEHYRKVREAKEKLRRSRSTRSISKAMDQLNADELLSSVDEFVDRLRHNVASIEARLDVALENLTGEESARPSGQAAREFENQAKKDKAQETIRQAKLEMGMLYKELEERAEEMRVEKTVGVPREEKGELSTEEAESKNLDKTETSQTGSGTSSETEPQTGTRGTGIEKGKTGQE